MDNTQRDIGRLGALVEQFEKTLAAQNRILTEKIDGLEAKIDKLEGDIANFNILLAQFKGGSKVVFFVGSLLGGGIGAAIVKWLPVLLAR